MTVVLVLVVLVLAGARVAQATVDAGALKGVTYTVHAGDTLWQITASHYDTRTHDVRELIYRIEKANHLEDEPLQPGVVLRLPYVE